MYREAPIVSDPTTEEKPMSNQNTLTRDEREQWASSHECCEYVAAALGWDDDLFGHGDDSIWVEAARNARAAGMSDGDTLHWGAQSRTVIAVFDCAYRAAAADAADAAAFAMRAARAAADAAAAAEGAAYEAAAADVAATATASRAAAAAMSAADGAAWAAADAADTARRVTTTTEEPK
jgi:hypothetical protein